MMTLVVVLSKCLRYLATNMERKLLGRSEYTAVHKTGRFDNLDSVVIISSTALPALLMMTGESMLTKRPVLRIKATLYFLLKLG